MKEPFTTVFALLDLRGAYDIEISLPAQGTIIDRICDSLTRNTLNAP
jgi:hypothetical protein